MDLVDGCKGRSALLEVVSHGGHFAPRRGFVLIIGLRVGLAEEGVPIYNGCCVLGWVLLWQYHGGR